MKQFLHACKTLCEPLLYCLRLTRAEVYFSVYSYVQVGGVGLSFYTSGVMRDSWRDADWRTAVE
jgi:hypothetical protein